MSNSSLATITQISPNKNSPRTAKIDTITIHHVAGVCSAQTLADIFAPTSRQASCNYGIGNDGQIALIVDESDRSWCSSSSSNDHRAITIEVSNNAKGDSSSGAGWTVGEPAYKALIDLCVDICQRNDIAELKWQNDSSLIGQPDKQNLTVHQWFSATACPGDYLLEKMGDIAAAVNARLGVAAAGSAEDTTAGDTTAAGATTTDTAATAGTTGAAATTTDTAASTAGATATTGTTASTASTAGATSTTTDTTAGAATTTDTAATTLYRVQVGAFGVKANAFAYLDQIKAAGFEGFVVEV